MPLHTLLFPGCAMTAARFAGNTVLLSGIEGVSSRLVRRIVRYGSTTHPSRFERHRRLSDIAVAAWAALPHIIGLSLAVSLSAAAAAAVVGLPLGAALAVYRFRGRAALILLTNALLGLPPVVVGLALYLLLSRSGPLGALGLLFTPHAMALAQFLLALPIVLALSHRAMVGVWETYGDDLLVSGATRLRAIPHLLRIGRMHALTASLAGLGRTVSEVGAIMIVGGNIAGYTRTMTTAIVLETSQGHLAFALALGGVLVAISIAVNASFFAIALRGTRHTIVGRTS